MAFFNSSISASLQSDPNLDEEDQSFLPNPSNTGRRKSRGFAALHRTFSSPSGGPTSSRFSRLSERNSRSFTCASRSSYASYRSLRGSSPNNIGMYSPRNSLKTSRRNADISSSVDFRCKTSLRDEPFGQNHRLPSISSSNQSDLDIRESRNDRFCLHRTLSPNRSNRVERSISSPGGLQPSSVSRLSFPFPIHSPSSPGRIRYATSTRSEFYPPEEQNNSQQTFPSPSLSYPGEFNTFGNENTNELIPIDRISNSFESVGRTSRQSLRRMSDQVSSSDFASVHIGHLPFRYQDSSSWWNIEATQNVGFRNLDTDYMEVPRLSSLAYSPLAGRDLSKLQFQSPPPSYEMLCNPESLPTYQEAIDKCRRAKKRQDDRNMIFTLPTTPDYTVVNPQEPALFRSLTEIYRDIFRRNAIVSHDSLDGSDCDAMILDTIPKHSFAEPLPKVPVSFISICSPSHFRLSRHHCRFLTPICNRSKLKRELDCRWPFLVSANEDRNFPGLMIVECSPHLAASQQQDSLSYNEDLIPSTGTVAEESTGITTDSQVPQSTGEPDPVSLNPPLLFYICGKCVYYDSFDMESVKAHMQFDCPTDRHRSRSISEMYLVLRAFVVVVVMILILMWLPIKEWQR